MKRFDRVIITEYEGYILSLGYLGSRIEYVDVHEAEDLVGCVYAGRVEEIKKSLGACFVRFTPKLKGFLRSSDCPEGVLPAQGEQIAVAVTASGRGDKKHRLSMAVKNEYREKAGRVSLYSVLRKGTPSYVKYLRTARAGDIVTDIPDIYDELLSEGFSSLRLYVDGDVPLKKLYSIKERMDELLSRGVWLDGGGRLVVDQTEALCVIDVNTGRSRSRDMKDEAVHAINLEAAREAARQIRLRNLSGIILIDFINYQGASGRADGLHAPEKEKEEELAGVLRAALADDDKSPRLVDITALGLAEITRRRSRPPVHELLRKT